MKIKIAKKILLVVLLLFTTASLANSKTDHILTGVVLGEVARTIVNSHRHDDYRSDTYQRRLYQSDIRHREAVNNYHAQFRRPRQLDLQRILCDYGSFTAEAVDGRCNSTIIVVE